MIKDAGEVFNNGEYSIVGTGTGSYVVWDISDPQKHVVAVVAPRVEVAMKYIEKRSRMEDVGTI